MDRDIAVALLDQLHAAQNEFYGGGGDALLRGLLASDIAWTVPGNNSMAAVYRGTAALLRAPGIDPACPRAGVSTHLPSAVNRHPWYMHCRVPPRAPGRLIRKSQGDQSAAAGLCKHPP